MSFPSITEARRPDHRDDIHSPFDDPPSDARPPDGTHSIESVQQFFVEWEVPQAS